MYELIILGLLMRFPAHGYFIANVINDMIGPYARLSNGRLYPLLAKLEQEGLIVGSTSTEETPRGERQQRSYEITDAGRERFHKLMIDTTSNPGEYQKLFLHKVPLLHLVKHSERLYLLDHYLNYCQAHILHLMAESEYLASRANAPVSLSQLETILDVMQHRIDEWRLELEWAGQLREKELARAEILDEQGKCVRGATGKQSVSRGPIEAKEGIS
ncbi:MAG TPA: PadR family transcriptional regulator [Ktedonobacteraceae bacterium]|nr:PadR family transcriptional regulator [Ktedonobacteraceae bacterium]